MTKNNFIVNIGDMRKFIQIPTAVQQDVVNGKLIGNDLVVYNYLISKAGHGEPIFFSNNKIAEDLGVMSYGKISASMNRLSKLNHIKRRKTCNKMSTQLNTFVINGDVLVRGRKL